MQLKEGAVPSTDPFEIIHNFRSLPRNYQKPRRKVSACDRYHTIPQFTMRTRKMTAEIELREDREREKQQEENEEEQMRQSPKQEEQQQQLLLGREQDELQLAIPFRQERGDVAFDLEQNSHASNYNRLERALFGFGLGDMMEEE